ncbi:hypothetical protein [Halegenticoccus tardaugens]|uniref:hypothetical protein n=1 Tax=Halegenticoccus tardaugens TaxID=2071624 RepID=UPI001E315704|nr:hypothetical protein [Halegenticoccus tardaugens]
MNFDHRDMMVFILIMSLNGLQNAVTELSPEFMLGPMEIGFDEFLFIPMTLVMLFGTIWAALAVPVGEIVFGEILIGEFDGLGAMENLIMLTTCYYFASALLKNPDSKLQLAIAVLVAEGLEEAFAVLIDVAKVYVGVEELEAVPGLPESIWAIELFDWFNQMLIAGVIFGLIPTLYLYPKLRGKLEPLLGMEPRPADPNASMLDARSLKLLFLPLLAFPFAMGFEILSESGGMVNVIWEPEFVETYGQVFLVVPIVGAIVVLALLWMRMRRNRTAA